MPPVTAEELIAFERWVAKAFEAGRIRAPVHLCSPEQAEPLLEIFREIPRTAWVLSTWRSHFHALLHGVPEEHVMSAILSGRSMNLNFPEYRFLTSAIVGGCLPIACGLAATGAEVWCFVGDMAASIGAFQDATNYAWGQKLGVNFVIENNELSTNTPTIKAWGYDAVAFRDVQTKHYTYKRTVHHVGTGKFVPF